MLNKKTLTSLFAPLLLAASIHSAEANNNDPKVTYSYPSHVHVMGERDKALNCGVLTKIFEPQTNKIQRLKINCDFAEELDTNNQKICKPERNKGAQMYDALMHFSLTHFMCVDLSGKTDLKFGTTPQQLEIKYGKGWQSKTFCPLKPARDQCMAAYQAQGLTVQ